MAASKRASGAASKAKPKAATRKGKGKALVTKPQTQVGPPILQQTHSFELMKIVNVAVISRIAFARQMFPNLRWEVRTFDPESADFSYDTYVKSKPDYTANIERVWKHLPRVNNDQVDKLLGWLENGVADAIEHGYLAKFQLGIHTIDGPIVTKSNLIESYTLTFTYGASSRIELSREEGDKSSSRYLAATKSCLSNLVNDVEKELNVSNDLLPLPSRCRLNMTLLYNDTCPEDYCAPMFRAGSEETMKILDSVAASKRLTVDTGFHKVSVGWGPPKSPERGDDGVEDSAAVASLQTQEDDNVDNTSSSVLFESSGVGDSTQPEAIRAFRTMGLSRHQNSMTQDTQPLETRVTTGVKLLDEVLASNTENSLPGPPEDSVLRTVRPSALELNTLQPSGPARYPNTIAASDISTVDLSSPSSARSNDPKTPRHNLRGAVKRIATEDLDIRVGKKLRTYKPATASPFGIITSHET